MSSDEAHMAIVAEYFRLSEVWDEPVAERRTPADHRGDPLLAVWATRR